MTPEQEERLVKAVEQRAAAELAAAAALKAASKPTKAELVWQMAMAHPQVTGLSDLNVVDLCVARADAFLKRFPDSISGPV